MYSIVESKNHRCCSFEQSFLLLFFFRNFALLILVEILTNTRNSHTLGLYQDINPTSNLRYILESYIHDAGFSAQKMGNSKILLAFCGIFCNLTYMMRDFLPKKWGIQKNCGNFWLQVVSNFF